jgi:hypothetical protein
MLSAQTIDAKSKTKSQPVKFVGIRPKMVQRILKSQRSRKKAALALRNMMEHFTEISDTFDDELIDLITAVNKMQPEELCMNEDAAEGIDCSSSVKVDEMGATEQQMHPATSPAREFKEPSKWYHVCRQTLSDANIQGSCIKKKVSGEFYTRAAYLASARPRGVRQAGSDS